MLRDPNHEERCRRIAPVLARFLLNGGEIGWSRIRRQVGKDCTCEECGSTFQPARPKEAYCSEECRETRRRRLSADRQRKFRGGQCRYIPQVSL